MYYIRHLHEGRKVRVCRCVGVCVCTVFIVTQPQDIVT